MTDVRPGYRQFSSPTGSVVAGANDLEMAIERMRLAQDALVAFDLAVARGDRPADSKQRWLLDLLRRCAVGRYEMLTQPD